MGRRVCPIDDEGRAREDGADGCALHAASLAVNEAHATEAEPVRLAQVFFDHTPHVAGRDDVQIEDICYLKLDRFGKWIVEINFVFVVGFIVNVGGGLRHIRSSFHLPRGAPGRPLPPPFE